MNRAHIAAGLLAVVGVLLPLGPSDDATAAGTDIASAQSIAFGQQLFGDSGTALYPYNFRDCRDAKGDYWKMTLFAGDRVKFQWESPGGFIHAIDVFDTTINDFNFSNATPISAYVIGSNNKAESRFVASRSGTYPVVFNNDCGPYGPYDFTAVVQHDLSIGLPVRREISRRDHLSVGVHTLDGQAITEPALQLELQIYVRRKLRSLGVASPIQGQANFSVSLARRFKGHTVRLRVRSTGLAYRARTATRKYIVT
jgi:hypothetical protein